MIKADYAKRRETLLSRMGENEIMVLFSGIPVPSSMDECFPFEVNRHFFYLTGLRRENMALLLTKTGGRAKEILFIEQPVPQMERWTGKRVTVREAKEISGCGEVQYIQNLMPRLERIMGREFPEKVWMDCHRESMDGVPFYNQLQAEKLLKLYPAMHLCDSHPVISRMRMNKDAAEIAAFRRAVEVTHLGLNRVLATLRPGMMEYAVQAEFEYEIKRKGAEGVSFPTIVGSGINGCSMHYEFNHSKIEEDRLVLLDLGARVEGYCADISRTYPASGHFTPRQRQYYDLVLRANREIARFAAPGKTLTELNDRCKAVLAEGLMEMGKISRAEEIGKYYMHGVSHQIGLDTHDAYDRMDRPLEPGMIISDEPGLYIDEECIGIRIEDDLLITEEGCTVLSEDIERTAEEIETIMRGRAEGMEQA